MQHHAAEGLHAEYLTQRRDVEVCQRPILSHERGVNQPVNRAEDLPRASDRRAHGPWVGDVGLDINRLAAGALYTVDRAEKIVVRRASSEQDDAGLHGRAKPRGELEADTASAAGEEVDAARAKRPGRLLRQDYGLESSEVLPAVPNRDDRAGIRVLQQELEIVMAERLRTRLERHIDGCHAWTRVLLAEGEGQPERLATRCRNEVVSGDVMDPVRDNRDRDWALQEGPPLEGLDEV